MTWPATAAQLQAPAATTYYTWDAHNRLTQAEPVAGPVTLAYDGDGRRTGRQTPTQDAASSTTSRKCCKRAMTPG